jgi:hypothetical protein
LRRSGIIFCSLVIIFSALDAKPQNLDLGYYRSQWEHENTPVFYSDEPAGPAGEEEVNEALGIRRKLVFTNIGPQDIERIGYRRYYPLSYGLKLTKFTGISTGAIFNARPISTEQLIWDAKTLGVTSSEQFLNILDTEFTRAVFGKGYLFFRPSLPSLQLSYEYADIRNTLRNIYSITELNQHTIEALGSYVFPDLPFIGVISLIGGYRRVHIKSDQDDRFNEVRNEIVSQTTLEPLSSFSILYGFDIYWGNMENLGLEPRQMQHQIEGRFLMEKLHISAAGGFLFKEVVFNPGDALQVHKKYYFDLGKDFGDKLAVTLKGIYNFSTGDNDFIALTGASAKAFDIKSRLSYEIFSSIFLKSGIDASFGMETSIFNNFGFTAELEFYNAGTVRTGSGFNYNYFYNIDDAIFSGFLKIFLFED